MLSPMVAREELNAQVAFQIADRCAQRLLRQMDSLGRTREVELLRDGQEVAQLPQLEPVRWPAARLVGVHKSEL